MITVFDSIKHLIVTDELSLVYIQIGICTNLDGGGELSGYFDSFDCQGKRMWIGFIVQLLPSRKHAMVDRKQDAGTILAVKHLVTYIALLETDGLNCRTQAKIEVQHVCISFQK